MNRFRLRKKAISQEPIDNIREKVEHLNTLNYRSHNAISIVNQVMDEMENIDAEIQCTISEINDSLKVRTETKDGLMNTFEKNERIKRNFAKLLEAE
jgi:hypothetical protein